MKGILNALLVFVCFALIVGQPAASQTVVADDQVELKLGSVQVAQYAVAFQIAYRGDAAILGFSVSDGEKPQKYAPMFASTYRGIPTVDLDVFVSKSEDAIWVRSSWPDSEMLAYHRLGTPTATTQYGEKELLDVPVPDVLSGGPVPFPEFDLRKVFKKASFYHRKES